MAADRRRAELEAKRAKLAELKKAREDRRTTLLATASSSRSETPLDRQPSSRAELNDLISSLLSPSSVASSTLRTPSRNGARSPNGFNASADRENARSPSAKSSQPAREESIAGDSDRAVLSGPDQQSESNYGPEEETSLPQLTSQTQDLFELPVPRPKITYDKSIQTADQGTSTIPGPSLQVSEDTDSTSVGRETEIQLRARLLAEFEAERARLDAAIAEERRVAALESEQQRKKGIPRDALDNILGNTDFTGWLDFSSKIVERALSDGYDYLKDYSIGAGEAKDEADTRSIKCTHTFSDDRWTRGRAVTALDWSAKFPELTLASYSKSQHSVNDPDGIACVWNLHLSDRPEYIFHAQSDILGAMFSPFHANLVVGSSYAGQILVWDTRAKSLPILKSPLSASGHTHPVYAMALPGTQNAHNLVSASTDGTVCAWVLDMLAKPVETLELVHPGHGKTDEVSVTSLAFPDNDPSTFLVGTEEGHAYAVNRYDRAGAKAGLVQGDVYRGHAGPITGLSFHPSFGPIDFGDLFLTSGVDWTTRLWRMRSQTPAATVSNKTSSSIKPLSNLEEADDYILDVRWHPHHPALFGRVDGTGRLDLWNLNADVEVPVVSHLANANSPRALNKLAWDKREGRRVAAGSSNGDVYVYDIADLANARESEWDQFRRTIAHMTSTDGTLAVPQ